MNELNDLITIIKSRTPIIVVESEDEVRTHDLVRYAAQHLKQNFYRWSVADRLSLANNIQNTDGGYQEPIELLRYIWSLKYPGPAVAATDIVSRVLTVASKQCIKLLRYVFYAGIIHFVNIMNIYEPTVLLNTMHVMHLHGRLQPSVMEY